MSKNRHIFDIQLNAITDSDNPTKKDVEFILHGFDVSHNYAFISKETAEKTLHTLKGMPIVALYKEKTSTENNDDALGSHEVEFSRDRDTGEPIITMGTVPIGVFTEDAYITTIIDNEGNEKEVVTGKGILWASRFPNVIGLLKEWMDEGISVVSSMEILYDSYKVTEGITEILSYVYEGHCILNSSDRSENRKKVYPAYDESRLTKLVAEAIEQEIKEVEKMPKFKKVFELSHSDIRSLLYTQLESVFSGAYSYITDVYETYFVVNVYKYDENDNLEYDKYYKVDYSKGENDSISINAESKAEVQLKRDWVEVTQFEKMQNELSENVSKVEELTTQLNEKETKISDLETQVNTVSTEKSEIEVKFNETTEKLTQLNSQVEELKPFKDQVEHEKLEKALNEKKEFYSAKFKALNAIDKFDSEEVQELVKKSINDSEAVLQLNTMLVEMVVVEKETKTEDTVIRELSSKRENLIPTGDDFESRYSN